MDELIEELGVSYDELYKIHTGRNVQRDSDCDSGDDTDSLDENLKPPPYSLDEINRNVAVFSAQTHTDNNGNSSIGTTFKEISKKLSLYISTKYCYICMKQSRKHYTQLKHYRKIKLWLENEISRIPTVEEVKLRNFFCEICHLALCGNDLAQKHYESKDHTNNSKNFCLLCLQHIPERTMPSHLVSKKHKKRTLRTRSYFQEPLLKIKLDLQNNSSPTSGLGVKNKFTEDIDIRQISNKSDNERIRDEKIDNSDKNASNDTSSKNNNLELMCTDNNGPNKYKVLTEYRALANIIMDLLTPSFCYVCNISTTRGHYNKKEHNQALETYIVNYVNSYGFYLKNIDNLICFACHAIFRSMNYAEIHNRSTGHLSNIKKFCNVCLQHLLGRSAIDHDQQPEHKTLVIKRKIETERKREIFEEENQATNPSLGEIFVQRNRSINNLKIHGIDVNVIRDIIEDKMDKSVQCSPIPLSVIELLTPTYCFVCNKSALKNNKGKFKHYTFMGHKKELKKLLHSKGETFGVDLINVESVYCDACNEIFLNSKLADEHYNTSEHKTIFYTSCEQKNKDSQLSLQKMDTSPLAPLKGQEQNNEKFPSKKQAGITITEKLKDLISPGFCFICKKNVNMHIFNHHYLGRGHTIKLRNWIDNEIKKSGERLDKDIIYCEDCSLELGGTHEDLKHYGTAIHLFNKNTYCSICIFRGTPNEVFEHMSSSQHKENSMKVLYRPKNDLQLITWPKKLTKLIKLSECKVCGVKLQTTEKADFHYCSERHNTNVKDWLDHYYQFGDMDTSIDRFGCSFCDSSFTSQQELNDHNNSHFPILRGTNGDDAFKSSSTTSDNQEITPEPEKQKALSDEISIDKIFLSPTNQLAGPASSVSVSSLQQTGENSNDNENCNDAKCYEEIKSEINKLLNTVYIVRTVPLKQSIRHLKELNSKLASYKNSVVYENICRNNKMSNETTSENTGETYILNNPSTSNHKEMLKIHAAYLPEGVEQDYVKTKLFMELHRLKMVIGNTSTISSHLAFKFIQYLNKLLFRSVYRDFDIDDIFTDDDLFIKFPKSDTLEDGDLQDEVDKLSDTLLDEKKMNTKVSLDFITQFNVQLESLLQYQKISK